MSDQSIFTEDQSVKPAEPNPAPVTPTIPPEVSEFVGEGKKYKSMEDALKSIPHAQSHIQKLEDELAANRAVLEKSRAMEELLQELRQQKSNEQRTEAPTQLQPQVPVDVDKAVEEALNRKEIERQAKQNAAVVIDAFKAAYGDESKTKFEELASETGLPMSALNNLARTSPDAVLKLAGLTKKSGGFVPHSTSSVRPGAVNESPEVSAKVKMVGSSTKDAVQAWRNAGVKAANKFNQK